MKFNKYLLFIVLAVMSLFLAKGLYALESTPALGGLDLNGFCNYLGQVDSSPVNLNDWQCNPNANKINMDFACKWQYKDENALANQTNPSNPYSWVCYSSQSPIP